jgi:alpha-galactosidase
MANDREMSGNGPEYMISYYFEKMAASLANIGHKIQYFVCQWGNGDNVGHWYVIALPNLTLLIRPPRASKVANTWRISGDIGKDWASIWRITNQVVPYQTSSAPGAFNDMDMLM